MDDDRRVRRFSRRRTVCRLEQPVSDSSASRRNQLRRSRDFAGLDGESVFSPRRVLDLGAGHHWAPGITGATLNGSLAQYSFSQQFFLAGAPQSGTISVAVDDLATVFVNGTLAGSTGSISDVTAAFKAQSSLATFNIAPYLTAGQNTITINAENGPAYYAGSDPNPPYSVNTAGVVFGGTITSNAAPVPEASTTVSFGLLLVLGGAAAFTVKRKTMRKTN